MIEERTVCMIHIWQNIHDAFDIVGETMLFGLDSRGFYFLRGEGGDHEREFAHMS